MPILFCNIAWMHRYAGRDRRDPPLGGGGFPRSEGYCGEECNFVPCDDGFVYGHFETIKGDDDRQVRIERLGAATTDLYVDGVDIVWTAPVEGNDPRSVVGWYRNARLYRHRQQFDCNFPSRQHETDEITSFRVRARIEDAVLLPVAERQFLLERGPGWSGQASWWYAEDTQDRHARAFVRRIENAIAGRALADEADRGPGRPRRRNHRAGRAADGEYQRYVRGYEAVISPRHDRLQTRFENYLRQSDPAVRFLDTFRDDLRYVDGQLRQVMAEIKPTEPASLRFAIRTAIGQLLDYRQNQQWTGRQLIVVETEVVSDDDLSLALTNGFGLAWPCDRAGFKVVWPATGRRRV